METLKSCPFEEPIGNYEIENDNQMTNDEWRKTCSVEEFAKWIENKLAWAAKEQGYLDANYWAKWLKQPHSNEVGK